MATRRTAAQRLQLEALNKASGRPTGLYALRMRPYLLDWEQRKFTQREIVVLLNDLGACVPSEWKDSKEAPAPVKQWSLTQYQRFRKKVNEVHAANTFGAKRDGRTNVRPKGDGQGLFARPELLGDETKNKRNLSAPRPVNEEHKAEPVTIETLDKALACYRAMPKHTRRDEQEMIVIETLLNQQLDERDRLIAGGAPRPASKLLVPLTADEAADATNELRKERRIAPPVPL